MTLIFTTKTAAHQQLEAQSITAMISEQSPIDTSDIPRDYQITSIITNTNLIYFFFLKTRYLCLSSFHVHPSSLRRTKYCCLAQALTCLKGHHKHTPDSLPKRLLSNRQIYRLQKQPHSRLGCASTMKTGTRGSEGCSSEYDIVHNCTFRPSIHQTGHASAMKRCDPIVGELTAYCCLLLTCFNLS